MQVFHITTRATWEQSRRAGAHTMSTHDRSLEDEGFIHACHRDQVRSVFARHWSGVREPLVLLVIDTDRLTSPWTEVQVGEETFPHIRGPIDRSAVVGVRDLDRTGGTGSLVSAFFAEMMSRILVVFLVMGLALAAAALGRRLEWEWAPFTFAVVALVVGGGAVGVWRSRRRP